MSMDTKQSSQKLELKAIDQQPGISYISGYAAIFGNVDSYGDIIMPGAFSKSIMDAQSRKIRLFVDHEMDSESMIGTVTLLKEDSLGLYFEATISQADSAQDVVLKAKEGHLSEVSIGFFIRDCECITDPMMPEANRILKDIELIEISLVSRAANPKAKLIEVKKEQKQAVEPTAVPQKDNNKEEIMTQEHNEKLIKSFEEKLEQLQKFLDQPVNKAPAPLEGKVERKAAPTMSKKEMEEEASALYFDMLKGDISRKEYKNAIETKALSSVVVENGGALIPQALHSEIIIKRDRINKIEQRCTKISGKGPLDILDYSFDPTWATHDDADTISETSISSIFGKSNLDPQDFVGLVKIPARLERRSFLQLQPLIAGDFARAYNDLKEDKIFLGTGHKEPLGISTMLTALSANLESVTAVANLDHTALVNVVFKLNEEYRNNGVFVMRPEAISKVMKLQDANGLPIWTHQRLQDGVPAQLLGYPVFESRALDDGASSGEIFVVFGDFSKYILLEEVGFNVEASREANFSSNQLTLRMVVSFDGMPVDKNAFAAIKMA